MTTVNVGFPASNVWQVLLNEALATLLVVITNVMCVTSVTFHCTSSVTSSTVTNTAKTIDGTDGLFGLNQSRETSYE